MPSRIGSWGLTALPFVGIVLALANWSARPDRALAWLTAIVALVLLLVGRRAVQLSARRPARDAQSRKALAGLSQVLTFGPLLVIVVMGVPLAEAGGVLGDADLAQRMTVVIAGLYVAAIGNGLPRRMPAASAVRDDPARLQTALRVSGWAWTLCGVAIAAAALFVPIGATGPLTLALLVVGGAVMVMQLLRVGRPRQNPADPG